MATAVTIPTKKIGVVYDRVTYASAATSSNLFGNNEDTDGAEVTNLLKANEIPMDEFAVLAIECQGAWHRDGYTAQLEDVARLWDNTYIELKADGKTLLKMPTRLFGSRTAMGGIDNSGATTEQTSVQPYSGDIGRQRRSDIAISGNR